MRLQSLVFFGAILAGNAAFAAITDDLVLYLPFDEISGTVAQDLSGNGRDAEVFNRRTIGGNPNAIEDGPLPTPDNGGTADWWFWNSEGRFNGAFAPRGIADEGGGRGAVLCVGTQVSWSLALQLQSSLWENLRSHLVLISYAHISWDLASWRSCRAC